MIETTEKPTAMNIDQFLEAQDTALDLNISETKDPSLQREVIAFTPWAKNWTQKVLSHIPSDEKIDGNPKVDGLRKICWKIFRSVITESRVVQSPNIENGGRAVVTVDVFATHYNGTESRSSGCADVYEGNCDAYFCKHATAVAETRAEGRAIRKLLCLVKVLAAEELYVEDNVVPQKPAAKPNADRINKSILNGLHQMCNKVGIDLIKLAAHEEMLSANSLSLDDLTKEDGRLLTNLIGSYQRNPELIPTGIKS